MPGPNVTGKPNTEDYNLGRGIVYFAPLVNSVPQGYRDLGNAPEFNISIEVETVEHQSSRQGLRVVDKEVVISQKISLTVTIDELNFENLALFFSGSKATHVNPAKSAQAEFEMVASVELGRWYDIKNAAGARAYRFTSTNALDVDNGTDNTDLVLGTDYELDAEMGRIFLLSTAVNISAGEALDITWSLDGTNVDVNEVQALKNSAVVGALKFISVNPAAGDARTEYQFHQVSLKAEGDFSLIGDEFTTMQLSGVAERNETADADSPTLTIREVGSNVA